MRVLVTGATGFVGRRLCSHMLERGWQVRGTLLASESPSQLSQGVEPVLIEPLGTDTQWSAALSGVDVVLHLAARVHIMNDTSADPLAEFRQVNVAGTERLASEASRCGVKRLVFVSSIKVNGEETAAPYTEDSGANPTDPYGISKWEAEQALRRVEAETGLEIAVVRPTLVYGPGVRANFLNLMRAVDRGIPLPLQSIANRRSLIYVGNLVDALERCAAHPAAAGRTYLVSDRDDVSTPQLVSRVAAALAAPARLLPLPTGLMRLLGKVTGKSAAVHRLCGSLSVDISKIERELGWTPPHTMEQGLADTAKWYRESC